MTGEVFVALLIWMVVAAGAVALVRPRRVLVPVEPSPCLCDDGLKPGPLGICQACLRRP